MKTTKLTNNEFINKAKLIHGDKYDYSLLSYCGARVKVKIVCSKHGVFEQTPSRHLSGRGCKKCSTERIANLQRNTIDNFVKEAKLKHHNKYDYSLSEYANALSKVKIICPIHGNFEQRAFEHLNGSGCWRCSHDEKSKKQCLTIKEFINKSNFIHNDKYNYSLSNYVNGITKIKIICPKHGLFQQRPHNHLIGQGCPICKESKGEKEIRKYLTENNIIFIHQYNFKDCKNIKTLSFDFYLPKTNTIIEYQGKQHFKVIDKWGGNKKLEKQLENDKIKRNYCLNNKINFITINYNENVNDILTTTLKTHGFFISNNV